jgi:hypothetical protein
MSACVQDSKRSRKKRREMRKKAKIRLAEAAAADGIGEEQDLGPEALFALGMIKGACALAAAGVLLSPGTIGVATGGATRHDA